jgi:hypothetical protein
MKNVTDPIFLGGGEGGSQADPGVVVDPSPPSDVPVVDGQPMPEGIAVGLGVATEGEGVVAVPRGIVPPVTAHPRFDVPGGWLILRPGFMDAHCSNPDHFVAGNACRVNKTICPTGIDSLAGRPAALLLAWLDHSSAFKDPGGDKAKARDAHGKVVFKCNRKTPADKLALDLPARKARRDWLVAQPELQDVRKHERLLRPGEPLEQPKL